MQVCLVWAQDRGGAIGRAGQLPWHIPEDLHRFKELTQGSPVVMGRKTWDSLPRRPLPRRVNYVVTRQPVEFEGALRSAGLQPALDTAQATGAQRVFVIGGQSLYEQAIPLADVLYVTRVDILVPEADTFAPAIDPTVFEMTRRVPLISGKVSLVFETYHRRATSDLANPGAAAAEQLHRKFFG